MLYLCVNIKSFYASVECVDRNKDPNTENLIVADRTQHTVMSMSPALINQGFERDLPRDINYSVVSPDFDRYEEVSAMIYEACEEWFADEDIRATTHSEFFIRLDPYSYMYSKYSATELVGKVVDSIYRKTGLKARAGVATNLYLAKVAADILYEKNDGSYVGALSPKLFMIYLWNHQSLTDFYDITPCISKKLAHLGISTMYEIAHYPEEKLYSELGMYAQDLIHHAWGNDDRTFDDLKKQNCISEIFDCQKTFTVDNDGAFLLMRSMSVNLVKELHMKNLYTGSIRLVIEYQDGSRSGGERVFNYAICSKYKILNEFVSLFWHRINELNRVRGIGVMLGSLTYRGGTVVSYSDRKEA